MNNDKLNQLFRAARQDVPPAAGPGFENLVLAAARRPMIGRADAPASLADQLGDLFPKLAWAAALLIALCVAADLGLAAHTQVDLTDSFTELSEQWLFAAN